MHPLIKIKITDKTSNSVWFLAKDKYIIRIDRKTKEASCSCKGDAFRKGGRKQKECNHIEAAKKIFKALFEGD